MLTISKEQFDALGVASFQDRMVNILREHFPEQLEGMDETELRQEIVNQARKAQLYGLTAEQPAAFFVLTAWLFGLGSMKKYPRWPPH